MTDDTKRSTRTEPTQNSADQIVGGIGEHDALEYSKRIGSKNRWADLREYNDTVYSTWEWGTVCEDFGHHRYYLGIESDDELLAGVPLMYNPSRLFGRKLVSMPYSPYGSILVRDDVADPGRYRELLLDDVKSLTNSLNAAQASIRGYDAPIENPDFTSVNNFVTFEVDLRNGEDEAWDTVASRFRRGVRKARKNDVRVQRGFDESMFSEYYEMYLDNMQYYGTPPYSRQLFRNIDRLLGEQDSFEMYLAYDEEGRPINGVTAFFHGDRAIYWTGVSDYEHRELNGGSLLLWEAISDACERGYPVFDLGRTRKDTGVYQYKESIGDPVELIDQYCAPNGVDSPPNPEEGYDLYKSIWQKLPTRATEYIGPHLRCRLSI